MFTKKYSGISKLANYANDITNLKNIKSRRALVSIGFIDDEAFLPKKNLERLGYNISEIGDLKSITEVKPYPIILCDIMGVGNKFDPQLQGAQIISEVKKNYPNIFVIAYTGANMQSRPAKKAMSEADRFLKKDADIDEWKSVLDDFVMKSTDPKEIWLRTRLHLCYQGIDTAHIMELEDAYVSAFETRDQSFKKLHKVANKIDILPMAKTVVLNVASNGIFAGLMAAL